MFRPRDAKNRSLSDTEISGAKKWGYHIMQDWKAARKAPSPNAKMKVEIDKTRFDFDTISTVINHCNAVRIRTLSRVM